MKTNPLGTLRKGKTIQQYLEGARTPVRTTFSQILSQEKESANKQSETPVVTIGTISKDNPTVANLLMDSPNYKKDCFKIIHSELNRKKEYRKISAGSTVYINKQTNEITWQKNDAKNITMTNNNTTTNLPTKISNRPQVLIDSHFRGNDVINETGDVSERLANAVLKYIGKPYKEINCYGLVVRGLKNLGVRYDGNGGLLEKL
ncbi:MAG: hypothetical protein HQK78_04895, partial [Desulfobacterales bacterium]|nr:hypothetical protein [Desulfobacterales bacterium]